MGKHDALSKTLAVTGVIVVALPLLAPIAFGVVAWFTRPAGVPFMIDFLMPFEIYPVTIVGVLLLLAAALRARDRRAAVAWSVGGMLGGVLLSGLAANLTGIADSVDPLPWWRYAPTIALGAGSLVAQVVLIVFGILLVKDLFAAKHATEPPAVPTA